MGWNQPTGLLSIGETCSDHITGNTAGT